MFNTKNFAIHCCEVDLKFIFQQNFNLNSIKRDVYFFINAYELWLKKRVLLLFTSSTKLK